MYNNSVSLYPSLENPIQASICELSSSFFSPCASERALLLAGRRWFPVSDQ